MAHQRSRTSRATKPGSSLVGWVAGVAVYPVVYAISLAGSLCAFCQTAATSTLELPIKALILCLKIADAGITDVLTFLTKRPGPKVQLIQYQQTVSQLQQENKTQQRQLLLLQHELDTVKLQRSNAQLRSLELSDELEALRRLLKQYQAATAAADKAQLQLQHKQQDIHEPAARRRAVMPAAAHRKDGLPQQSWYLHACVLLSVAGLRWWLMHQRHPLQQQLMLVVVWPAAWLYAAILFNCFPQSSKVGSTLMCFCWALLGYIGHEVVDISIRQN